MLGSRKEDALKDAALLHLEAGEVERCCDLLALVGEWDRALALAPACSLAYWRALMQRRARAAAAKEAVRR